VWSRNQLSPSTFYVSMVTGGLVIPAAVRSFHPEKPVYWREASTGASRLAYFIGKALADIPYIAVLSLAFVASFIIIAPIRAPAAHMVLLVTLHNLVIAALGYIFAAGLESLDGANLLGVTIALVANLFGGFVPLIGTYGYYAYTRWFQRGMTALEVTLGMGLSNDDLRTSTRTGAQILPPEHSELNWAFDAGMLVVFYLAILAIGYAVMTMRNRDKQR